MVQTMPGITADVEGLDLKQAFKLLQSNDTAKVLKLQAYLNFLVQQTSAQLQKHYEFGNLIQLQPSAGQVVPLCPASATLRKTKPLLAEPPSAGLGSNLPMRSLPTKDD